MADYNLSKTISEIEKALDNALNPDTTFSESGKPADAKAVGDALNSVIGQPGADGYSPTVSITKSGDTTTIKITDKDGTKTATIKDGEPGEPGADGSPGAAGKDGTSPTVAITEITGGYRISITDKTGTKSADIKHGATGQDGKSAYQYAKDGGYTGTEVEFTAKLAEEYSDEIYVGSTEPTDPNIKIWVDPNEKEPEAPSVNVEPPDWSQNDETAADYVKNRTHWVEEIEEVIVEEAVYPYDADTEGILFPGKTLVVGDTYIVRWNDVEYECVPFEVVTEEATVIYMGNPAFTGGDDNGMPFGAVDMGGIIAFIAEEDTKIGVVHKYTKYHQLDRNFVPHQSLVISPAEKFADSYKAYGNTDELAYYLLNGLSVWINLTALEGMQQMYQVVSWNVVGNDEELLPSGNRPYLPLQLWMVKNSTGFDTKSFYCYWNAGD